jgi:hypothetical protein
VDDVFLAGFKGDLMDQAFAAERDKASAGEARGAPVCYALYPRS